MSIKRHTGEYGLQMGSGGRQIMILYLSKILKLPNVRPDNIIPILTEVSSLLAVECSQIFRVKVAGLSPPTDILLYMMCKQHVTAVAAGSGAGLNYRFIFRLINRDPG